MIGAYPWSMTVEAILNATAPAVLALVVIVLAVGWFEKGRER